ncbi:hypothetical protein GF327_06640 [Candidatus Woesearchaeota archaeon]|nr:hypothetical protein [Candidatus Woesearchaeota archaeon]
MIEIDTLVEENGLKFGFGYYIRNGVTPCTILDLWHCPDFYEERLENGQQRLDYLLRNSYRFQVSMSALTPVGQTITHVPLEAVVNEENGMGLKPVSVITYEEAGLHSPTGKPSYLLLVEAERMY